MRDGRAFSVRRGCAPAGPGRTGPSCSCWARCSRPPTDTGRRTFRTACCSGASRRERRSGRRRPPAPERPSARPRGQRPGRPRGIPASAAAAGSPSAAAARNPAAAGGSPAAAGGTAPVRYPGCCGILTRRILPLGGTGARRVRRGLAVVVVADASSCFLHDVDTATVTRGEANQRKRSGHQQSHGHSHGNEVSNRMAVASSRRAGGVNLRQPLQPGLLKAPAPRMRPAPNGRVSRPWRRPSRRARTGIRRRPPECRGQRRPRPPRPRQRPRPRPRPRPQRPPTPAHLQLPLPSPKPSKDQPLPAPSSPTVSPSSGPRSSTTTPTVRSRRSFLWPPTSRSRTWATRPPTGSTASCPPTGTTSTLCTPRSGRDSSDARFVSFDVPDARARWVDPGEEWNKIGYFRVFGVPAPLHRRGRRARHRGQVPHLVARPVVRRAPFRHSLGGLPICVPTPSRRGRVDPFCGGHATIPAWVSRLPPGFCLV